jgi:hypothetical protein
VIERGILSGPLGVASAGTLGDLSAEALQRLVDPARVAAYFGGCPVVVDDRVPRDRIGVVSADDLVVIWVNGERGDRG